MDNEYQSKPNITVMISKLDELYAKEEKLLIEINVLMSEYDQLQEDKELLQNIIMYQSNRNLRETQKNQSKGLSILDRIRRM